jgi:AraC-like DNA-binding protein
MVYLKFKPSPSLEPFVECYFSWSSEGVPVKDLTVESPPNGFCSMVFNVGDTYVLRNKKFNELKVPRCFVSGQGIYTYQLFLNGIVHMCGIVFKPAALATLFDLPTYQYTEERISLYTIFDNSLIDHIYNDLAANSDANAQMKILESFLLRQLHQCKPLCDQIDLVANKIIGEHGMLSVSDMMKNVFTSRRNFERRFFRKVGLSPKYYARIARMSYLMNTIAGKKHVEWKQLFHKCAFYDQSHFIKDFLEFTGRTPQKYLEDNQELAKLVDKPRSRRIED